MKAFYSLRENRELAMLASHELEASSAMRGEFERFVAALQAGMFGEVGGTVRVASGSPYEPSIETCSISELALRWGDRWLVDAKLELQPTVQASDGMIELVALAEDEWPLGEVTLRPCGERWSVIGRPEKVRDESLLFVEVDFDPPGESGIMVAWFRSKTDLWLAYGLDGEPTGPDQQANRVLLIEALRDVAARTDAMLNAPSEGAIAEISTVRNLAPLVPGLAAQGPAKAEALAAALANVTHWSPDAREALAKLAASNSAEANRLFGKVAAHTHIPGTDSWTLLVGREVGQQAKLLDYESSLDKAIELFPKDPTVAVEVNYYKGARIANEDLDLARADKTTFNKPVKTHKNIDVEAADARYEMKRVAPELVQPDDVVAQVREGVSKFRSAQIRSLGGGGAKKNIVEVRYDDKIKIPGFDATALRARVEDYIGQNRQMIGYVDEIILHAELGGANVEVVVEVK